MKSLFRRYVLLVFAAMLAFSCERSVQSKAKVTFYFEGGTAAAPSLSAMGGIAGSSSLNEYSPVSATTNSGANPINCYLVVSTSQMIGEPGFNQNYCRYDNSNPDLRFGEYVGLLPAVSGGMEVSMSIEQGRGRRFMLLGVHAIDISECKDVLNRPDKSKLTKPYVIGYTNLIDLQAGGDVSVSMTTVNLNIDAPTNQLDDCIFSAAGGVLPIASSAKLGSENFPWNVLKSVGGTGSFYCQPMDITLTNSGELARAAEDMDLELFVTDVASAPATIDTYEDYSDCLSGSSSSDKFRIRTNNSKIRVWFRTDSVLTTNPNRDFFVREENSSFVSPNETFKFAQVSSTVVVNHDLDLNIKTNTCYEVSGNLENLYGTQNPPGSVPTSIPLNLTSTNNDVGIFQTNTNCTTPITLVATTSFTFNYAIKSSLFPTNSEFKIQYTSAALPALVDATPLSTIQGGAVGAVETPTYYRVIGPETISYGSVGADRCVRLTLRASDTLGLHVPIGLIPPALRILNNLESNYQLYDNDPNCSSTALAVNSQVSYSASATSLTEARLYIKVPPSSSPGHFKIQFGDTIFRTGTYEFDIIDENLHQ